MTVTVEKRIAALERENADLKARLDALQLLLPANKSAPSRRDGPQVRITTPPLADVALPTENEFRRLLAVVLDRYPMLRTKEDPADYAAQFRAAFVRLAHCGRRDKVDKDRGLGWWVDDCRDWCRSHNVQPTWVGGAAFTAAVVAHGDIRYVIDEWPHGFSVALQFGGGGSPSKDWWRRVLAGTLLEPLPPERPKPAFSPVSVAGGR